MPQQKELITQDGFKIIINEFKPVANIKANIIISPATGVTQRFYKDLALFLKNKGYNVITFDFRDIGLSKSGRMKDSKASFSIWALKDFKAVFEYSLKERKTAVIGHSFGALAFTIQENANKALGLYGFGTGTGHSSFMSTTEKIKAFLLWNVIAPPFVALKGFLPGKISGMGSHIPKNVYLEWKKWCHIKGFWLGDASFKHTKHTYSIDLPITIVASSDDPWTPIKSSKAYYSLFNNNQTVFKEVKPKNQKIGHIGYFLKKNREFFWNDLENWLEELC